MKQSFIKTIQGHQLEFNKQVCPAGYQISPKNIEFKGALSMQKDERGMWNVSETEHLPAWFNEISLYVHNAIEENETKGKNTSNFYHYGDLF